MLLAALLVSTAGCGEIDLPQPEGDTPPTQSTPGGSPSGGAQDETGGGQDETGGSSDETGGSSDETGGEETQSKTRLTSDGHLLIDDTFYLSVQEWRQVVSAYNAATPSMAADKAEAYKEGDLDSGWRIPTEDDVRLLRDVLACEGGFYGKDLLPQLNHQLEEYTLAPLSPSDRYLCDEGRKTYTFKIDDNVSKAGAKTGYRLRLVHDK